MPKMLSYEKNANVVRDVEIPIPNDLGYYTVRARMFGKKIFVETISGPDGRITTASDMVKETKLTVNEIKWLIEVAFL